MNNKKTRTGSQSRFLTMSVVLATGSLDHKVRFWEATSGNCIKTFSCGEIQVNCLQISSDKQLLAVGCNPLVLIFAVNGNEDKPCYTYDGHSNNVTAIGFRRDMAWMYSGSEDGTIKIWDFRVQGSGASTGQTLRSFDCGCAVNTVILSPNQSILLSGDQNGFVKVWDIDEDKCVEEVTPACDMPIRSISMALDSSIVAVGTHRGRVYIYNVTHAKGGLAAVTDFAAHDEGEYLLKCVIAPDCNTLATTASDRAVKLWNTATWKVDKVLAQHQKWVWDAVYSADSAYLVSVSSDQSTKLWNLSSGEVIRNYTGHNLAVTCVALNDSS